MDSSPSHQDAGGLNAFYWYQIFALDSAVVELQKLFSSHGSLLTIALYYHAETSLCFCAQPRKSLRFLNLTQRARLLEIQEYITRNGCWLSIYLYVVCSFLKEENRRECLTAALTSMQILQERMRNTMVIIQNNWTSR